MTWCDIIQLATLHAIVPLQASWLNAGSTLHSLWSPHFQQGPGKPGHVGGLRKELLLLLLSVLLNCSTILQMTWGIFALYCRAREQRHQQTPLGLPGLPSFFTGLGSFWGQSAEDVPAI